MKPWRSSFPRLPAQMFDGNLRILGVEKRGMKRLGQFKTILVAGILAGCGPGGAPGSPAPTPGDTPGGVGVSESVLLVPSGYGTLVQDQITLRIQEGDLLIKITPLEEWVIRLTAPDTYARLRGMAQGHGQRAAAGALSTSSSLFLVSFFSYQPDVTFEPEDLLLVNRGLRYRPRGIAAVTPSWGTQRLGQQETQMAVYAFDGGMDLESDLVAEYLGLRNEVWRDGIVPLLRAEMAKVRARAGGT